MKILLLEDDEILNALITQYLRKTYDVYSFFDGQEALDYLYTHSVDLLLLDINVPSIHGDQLLQEIRDHNIKIPAIFITSLNQAQDVKKGFDIGCDDYIKKPFEFEELEARLENIKRLYKLESQQIVQLSENLSYHYQQLALYVNDNKMPLSKKEAKIFEYLIGHANRTISIEELCHNIWSMDELPSDSTIRTHIKNLRKKSDDIDIQTIKGVGYCFNTL